MAICILAVIGGDSDKIDLSPFNAEYEGVSRYHATLRPSTSALYLIDQGSTNGTTVNGKKIGKKSPQALFNGDVISFGKLEFDIRILGKPKGRTDLLNKQVSLADALGEMAKAITSQLKPDQVLEKALDMTMSLTEAGESAFWLVDDKTGELYMEAQRGIEDPDVLEMRLPVDASLAGEVIETGKPLRANRETEQDKIKVKTGYLVESIMYLPLTVGGVTIGVLFCRPSKVRDEFYGS